MITKLEKILCLGILYLSIGSMNLRAAPPTYTRPWIYPLFIAPQISGSFAELRSTHYHGGIDFRTRQRTGLRVRSVDTGILYQAVSSATSYGKALYILHPDGRVSLYAHLRHFRLGLEKQMRKLRKEKGEKEVVLRNLHIPICQGQVIALSGNTGASAGPHLHFEARSSPQDSLAYLLNPALFGLTVKDHTAPELKCLALYPLDSHSLIQQANSPLYLPLPALSDTLEVRGRIGLGLASLDHIEQMTFNYGLYSLLCTVNGDTLAYYQLDSLPLTQVHTISSHVDTAYYRLHRLRVEKLYVDTTTSYHPYTLLKNKGVLETQSQQIYTITFTASDFANNRSFYTFYLRHSE